MFDRCDLSSATWLDRDEFVAADVPPRAIHAIALHDWLVESGIDPRAAKTVSTELVFAYSPTREAVFSTGSGSPLLADQRLPWAHRGDRLVAFGPLIYVTSREVKVADWDYDDAKVVARAGDEPNEPMELDDQELRWIFEAWDREHGFIVFADRETPWELLRWLQSHAQSARIAPLRIAVLVDSARDPLRTIALPDAHADIPDAMPIQDVIVGSPM